MSLLLSQTELELKVTSDHLRKLLTTSRGKVFVYTGILPICQDEDGLAAVLGHEIAHVIARHPAERMSTSFLTFGTVFLVSLLFDVSGQLSSMLVNLMWSLPNSRTQEAEADNIGLIMMSKACYNPEAAVRLWHRMQQQEKGAPPQFMSTHPSSYNREEAIRGWLERAKSVYVENGFAAFARGELDRLEERAPEHQSTRVPLYSQVLFNLLNTKC